MKQFLFFTLLIFLTYGTEAEAQMNEDEAQKIWEEYHSRVLSRRIYEAEEIIQDIAKNSDAEENEMILDFKFFSDLNGKPESLVKQLSENYEMSIGPKDEKGYTSIIGTTRPYSIELSAGNIRDWVEFMHGVALSYGAIFNSWKLTLPTIEKTYLSETIETPYD